MGYSWTTASGTVQDEIISEIHNNLDLLCGDLEIDEESWTTVTEGTEIDDTQIDDIKAAVIRADYWNYCRSHNASYDTSDDTLHNSGHDDTQNLTQYDGHYSMHDALYKIGAYDTHFNGRLYYHYTNHNEANESDNNSEEYTGYDSGKDATYRSSENSTVYKSKDSSKQFDDNISADVVDHNNENSSKHAVDGPNLFRTFCPGFYNKYHERNLSNLGCLSYYTSHMDVLKSSLNGYVYNWDYAGEYLTAYSGNEGSYNPSFIQ